MQLFRIILEFIRIVFNFLSIKKVPFIVGIIATAIGLIIAPYYIISAVIASSLSVWAVMWYSYDKNKEVGNQLKDSQDKATRYQGILAAAPGGQELLSTQENNLYQAPDGYPSSILKIHGMLCSACAVAVPIGLSLQAKYKKSDEKFFEGSCIDEVGSFMAGLAVIIAGFSHIAVASKLRNAVNGVEDNTRSFRNLIETHSMDNAARPLQQKIRKLEEEKNSFRDQLEDERKKMHPKELKEQQQDFSRKTEPKLKMPSIPAKR